MRDLFEAIASWAFFALLGAGLAVAILFVLAFIFNQISKTLPDKKCAIEFSNGSKFEAINCSIYRDSTNLDCKGINYSMYAVKSWECK